MTISYSSKTGGSQGVYVQNPVHAFNSSATTATDTTSFGYGEGGMAIQAFAPTGTTAVSKRVRCPYPNPKFFFLMIKPAGRNWLIASDAACGFGYNNTGSTFYGIDVYPTTGSTTDFDVNYYSLPYPTSSWTTYASNGTMWKVVFSETPFPAGIPTAADGIAGAVALNTGATTAVTGEYSEATVTINGANLAGGSGSLKLVRNGRSVNLTSSAIAHTSSASITSSAGVIPSGYRPSATSTFLVFMTTAVVAQIVLFADGSFRLDYRDWAGATTAQTGLGTAFGINYATF